MTRYFYTIIIASSLLLSFTIPAKAQIMVTTDTFAVRLAQKIVGQGVTIMNAKYRGGAVSAGTFEVLPGFFPINSGIVLTSGQAKTTGISLGVDGPSNYSNPNDNVHASTSVNVPGDQDLNNFSGKNTLDACVLEFDFIPQGDSINVNYIFGSEEYPRYTCSDYNDVFAFLITGPGFPVPTNIATVPGTNIPVAINSINDGIPGSEGGKLQNCTSMGAGSPFTQYYVSNQNSTVLTYNGRTVVLTAKAKVERCQVYHIKLAVADAEDRVLDSGVFIEAGSFSSEPDFLSSISGPNVNANNEVVLVEGCRDAELKITRGRSGAGAFTVNIDVAGTAQAGVDYTAPPVQVNFSATDTVKIIPLSAFADAIAEGTEKAILYLYTLQGCAQQMGVRDSVVFYIVDSLTQTSRIDTSVCSAFPTILSGPPPSGGSQTYLWSTGSTNQSISVTAPGRYILRHTVTDQCINIDTFNVTKGDPTVIITNVNPVVCAGSPLLLTLNTNADSIRWNTGASTNTLTVTQSGTYIVTGKNRNGCYISDTVVVAESPAPDLDLGPDTALCAYESLRLNAFFPGATYLWSTGETTHNITIYGGGTYSVASTLDGCTVRDTLFVRPKQMPIANAGPNIIMLENTSRQLNAVQSPNNASYVWTPPAGLNNPLIPNPVTTPDGDITYTLHVTSFEGCVLRDELSIKIVPALVIYNAFSPNGDGINDKWMIGNIDKYPGARVSIYNRYGQLMFSSIGYRTPWDGTHNGRPVAPATYYYVIEPGEVHGTVAGWVVLLK